MKHTPTALDKVVIMQKYNDSDKVLECRKEFEEAENTIVHAVKMHEELVQALINLLAFPQNESIKDMARKAISQAERK